MNSVSILLLALVAVARADFPLNPRLEDVDFEEPAFRNNGDLSYRLPEDLDPIHYDVEITPYFNATTTKEAFTFDGTVTITLRAQKANLTALIIQENVRDVIAVTLTTEDGVPLRLQPFNPFERIRQYQFLRVNLGNGVTLENGRVYKLRVGYIGNINETPLSRGVFRGNYKDSNGVTRWYLATHLQPTHSRQMFPSFDEPGFKSTFNIVVNRPAHFAETYANMRLAQSIPNGDRVKEIFETTPRMSAYLVTIHVSEGFTVIADNNNTARSYRILARPNTQGQGDYALEVGPPITNWLSNYFGIDYYSMQPNIKNDQIASPFWASGATENWGLVTYRELRLLYEEGETNAQDKLSIGTITAHELAHKWFGNLITCRWWDNVWINEGFASYFEYWAMHGVYPELDLDKQFAIDYVHSALSSDSSAATRALQHIVNSPTEVTGHFSGISYTKGASLLLMLKHLVTENTFKKALSSFLRTKSYEHAFPSDLYSAFAAAVAADGVPSANFDIFNFMKYWVEEPGYPLLNVDVNMATGAMRLSQERFFISATTSQTAQIWPIPLTYTTGRNPNWNNLQPTRVMTQKNEEVSKNPGEEWVIFNLQQKGMYRVNYDTRNWQLIANALSANYSNIHEINRAQIVDDVFALMRSQKMTYQLGFQVLDFLKKDTSYYSWSPAITGFTWLRNRFLHLPTVSAEFDEILRVFFDAAIKELGYNVNPTEHLSVTLNRFYLMTFACNVGHRGCIEDAEAKFRALINNNVSVNPNLRRHVFCQGLRAGGLAEWQYLYNRRQRSNNQAAESAMLRALGCTTNDQARQLYLNMILDDDVVKAQDRVNAFTFFYMGDRSNAKVALQYLKQNMDAVRRGVTLPASANSIISGIAGYLDEEGLQDMEQWLRANPSLPEYATGISAINSARSSMQWGTENAQTVLAAARGSAAISV